MNETIGAKQGLSMFRKVGYASGIISESVLYNMFFTYFLIFLTNIAMISPALAGFIALISVTWDAVADPLIGYYSDRKGRDRRKFILISAVPIGLTFMLAFNKVSFSGIGNFIYYIVVAVIFWLCYTTYTIPYYALCAEITEDYDERTKIRGMSSFINAFAIFVGSAAPMLLVGAFAQSGIEEARGWFLAALVLGSIAIVTAFITYFSVKGIKLIKPESADANEGEGLIKTYASVVRLKPFKWLIVFVLFYLIASSMSTANLMYLIQYRVGISAETISLVLLVTCGGMLILVPLVTWMSTVLDRRTTCIIFFSIEIIGLLVLKLVGISSLLNLLILAGVATLGVASFWTIFYPMAYDLVEVDEFVNNKRREGAITSFPQFIQKIGAAVGMQIAGLVLTLVGYDATLEVQSAGAVMGIENISTIIAAVLLFVSLMALVMYPVTKKRFVALQEELEKKRNNQEYSTELINKLV